MGYLAALAAAVLCALAVRRQHGGIVSAAGLLCLGWAVNWWSYGCGPIGCMPLSHATGVASEVIWAYVDAICGAMVGGILGRYRAWGMALWALYLFQCCLHLAREAGLTDYPFYKDALDAAFLGQCGIFILTGGRHVGDYLRSFPAVRRLGRAAQGLAFRKAA